MRTRVFLFFYWYSEDTVVKGDILSGRENFKELFEGSDLEMSTVLCTHKDRRTSTRVCVCIHAGPSVENFV